MTITNFESAVLVAKEAAAPFQGTSFTSLTIGTGTKIFIAQAGLPFKVGQRVRIISNGAPANYMEGNISSYAGVTMSVAASRIQGSGTAADWSIVVASDPGSGDLLSSLNLADVGDKDVARTTLYAAPLDMQPEPLFYNGAFLSDVRNEGAANVGTAYYQAPNTPSVEAYTLEQVRALGGAGSVLLVRQDIGLANQGFANSMQVYCYTAKSSSPAGEIDHLEWTIEGSDIARLQWGTANAKPLTIQFWWNDSITTTRSIQMMPGNNFCSCVKSFTTVAGQYVFRTITFPALTAAMCSSFGGTIPTAIGSIGLKLLIDLGSGSNFVSASPDAWAAGVSTVYPGAAYGSTAFTRNAGGTINMTGLQEDIGSIALPYRHMRRDVMERKVQRYIYKSLPQGIRWIPAGGSGNWSPHSYVSMTDALLSGGGVDIRWPVEMSRAPDVFVRSPVSSNSKWRNYSAGTGGSGADSGDATVVLPYQRGCFIANPGAAGDVKGSLMQINVLANANLGGL